MSFYSCRGVSGPLQQACEHANCMAYVAAAKAKIQPSEVPETDEVEAANGNTRKAMAEAIEASASGIDKRSAKYKGYRTLLVSDMASPSIGGPR